MKAFGLKHLLLTALLLPAAASAQTANSADSLWTVFQHLQVPVPDRCIAIVDVKMPRNAVGKHLYRIRQHPKLDTLLTPEIERRLLAEINRRCDSLGKDSLLTSELFYVTRPYFDWAHHEDPHYRIYMMNYADWNVYRKASEVRKLVRQLRTPAFSLLQINDTLVVDRSLIPEFRRGDRIVSMNGVRAEEYLKYCYRDRYMLPVELMNRYYYSHIVNRFQIGLERDGKSFEVETQGQTGNDVLFRLAKAEELDQNIRTYADAGCGYIAIPEFFFNNSRLIRIVHQAIGDFKKQGITDIILDLRRNPGGYGHAFDELLSIFIDKPVIDYCTGQRIKVTETALKSYKFLKKEQEGQLVDLPDGEIVRNFQAVAKMYIPGMTYYVMVGPDTGSIAASFVNMLQYHGAAKLAGEPLRHNALKYGEEDEGHRRLPTLLAETSVSMVEIDELTRRDDGQVLPDIPIPAVAADYLTGRDGQLDRLLEYIRRE